ncbi:hypothetical protein Rsub_03079 [Raphidocelis subcapitata]|uniref:Uncharacterized protein n=1 Tax=Raphidocelis subcapitata TaxID=307507 RepID=A0A2V0NSX4_9CHLO|nr:hypothetical protein Rsub_03079 [Raphidocelis subcapitata]|eukprot:GBF90778.1 hypothetical protein Rsub_03079 [Raphidocelis subcapitata]
MASASTLILVAALVSAAGAAAAGAAPRTDSFAPAASHWARKLQQDVAATTATDAGGAPFSAADAADALPLLRAFGAAASGLSGDAPRPFCRGFDVFLPVEARDPVTRQPTPKVYAQAFGSLRFSFQARSAATGEFVKVSPSFSLDQPSCVFRLSDGSESPTYDDASRALPVGWRCSFGLDAASAPPASAVDAGAQVFKAGTTCSMTRRFASGRFVRYLGSTSADVTFSLGQATPLTVECGGLATRVCGAFDAFQGREALPCAQAGLALSRAGSLTSANGEYALPPASEGGVPYRAIVYGFGQVRTGTVLRTYATVVVNPRRDAIRVDCRFADNTC